MAKAGADLYPTTLELHRPTHEVTVTWSDGHTSRFSMRYLRGFCPCAHCQGHAPGHWTFVPVDGPTITKVEEVGNYAVTIAFSDGHSTGIYTYDVLRELCPCASCQERVGPGHALRCLPAGEKV